MAEKGRCPCGYEADVKKVVKHQDTCDQAIAAFKAGELVSPAALYAQHQEWLNSDEYALAKEERTATKHAGYRAEAEAKIARSKNRWGSHLTKNESQVIHASATSLGNVEHEVNALLDPNPPNGPNAHAAPEPTPGENIAPVHPTYGQLGEKIIDGVPASEILENREKYSKMQVLRAEVATRGR